MHYISKSIRGSRYAGVDMRESSKRALPRATLIKNQPSRLALPRLALPCLTRGAQAGVAGETHAFSFRPSLACAHT